MAKTSLEWKHVFSISDKETKKPYINVEEGYAFLPIDPTSVSMKNLHVHPQLLRRYRTSQECLRHIIMLPERYGDRFAILEKRLHYYFAALPEHSCLLAFENRGLDQFVYDRDGNPSFVYPLQNNNHKSYSGIPISSITMMNLIADVCGVGFALKEEYPWMNIFLHGRHMGSYIAEQAFKNAPDLFKGVLLDGYYPYSHRFNSELDVREALFSACTKLNDCNSVFKERKDMLQVVDKLMTANNECTRDIFKVFGNGEPSRKAIRSFAEKIIRSSSSETRTLNLISSLLEAIECGPPNLFRSSIVEAKFFKPSSLSPNISNDLYTQYIRVSEDQLAPSNCIVEDDQLLSGCESESIPRWAKKAFLPLAYQPTEIPIQWPTHYTTRIVVFDSYTHVDSLFDVNERLLSEKNNTDIFTLRFLMHGVNGENTLHCFKYAFHHLTLESYDPLQMTHMSTMCMKQVMQQVSNHVKEVQDVDKGGSFFASFPVTDFILIVLILLFYVFATTKKFIRRSF